MSEPWGPDELEQLIRQLSPGLRLFAAQWSRAPEDVVQEALIKLVRQRRRPENPKAWLYRVVRNLAISLSRAQRRRRNHESRAARPAWFVAQRQAAVEASELEEALESLDQPEREVIVARIWGRLGYAELADVLAVSTATAHRRFQQALQALKHKLGISCPNDQQTNAKNSNSC